jgi:hypothetical protein
MVLPAEPSGEHAMHVRTSFVRRSLPALMGAGMIAIGSSPVDTADFTPDDKPSISVKASPAVGFAPMRVVLTAELKGGSNDYEQFYCAAIEWDIMSVNGMGDGNKSEQKLECDPYVAGKSEIKRRFVREQIFKTSGEYRIRFNLKQKNKIVGGGGTTIRVREGLGDGGPGGF